MHERHPIEKRLRKEAERISKDYNGAPVIIIIGGTGADVQGKGKLNRNMLGTSLHKDYRLRDLIGILQTALQIETLKHFSPDFLKKEEEIDKLVTC
jgi:hypothetical protein